MSDTNNDNTENTPELTPEEETAAVNAGWRSALGFDRDAVISAAERIEVLADQLASAYRGLRAELESASRAAWAQSPNANAGMRAMEDIAPVLDRLPEEIAGVLTHHGLGVLFAPEMPRSIHAVPDFAARFAKRVRDGKLTTTRGQQASESSGQ